MSTPTPVASLPQAPATPAQDRPAPTVHGSGSGRRGPVDLRLIRLARPAAPALLVLVALSVVQSASALGVALGAGWLVAALVVGQPWSAALAVLAGCLLMRTLAAAALPAVAQRVSGAVITQARQRGLRALARRSASRREEAGAGEAAVLLSTGLEPLRPWFAAYLPSLVVAAVLPPAAVVLLAFVDWPSATTVLLTLPLVPLFAALIGWATQRQADAQYARGGRLAGHFLDVVRGLVTLRLVDRADRQVEEVRDGSRHYARATTKVLSLAFLSSTALDLVATVSVGLVAVGAGVRLAGGDMTLLPAVVAILLAPEAYRPLREAGAQFHASAQASAVMDRLEELLAPPDSAPCTGGAPSQRQAWMRAATVRYPGRRSTLELPDLALDAGELVALVGESGSGKTTALRVLAGRLSPDAGSAAASGAVLVPQRPTLPLAQSVRVALDASDKQCREMLGALGLAELSLDTPLGEDGTGLSQGQRHRIALAAAALRARKALSSGRPVTLLLDEPTAHLDAQAETQVIALLTDLARSGAAVLVATHRPALVAAAARVVPLPERRGGSVDAALPPSPAVFEPDPPHAADMLAPDAGPDAAPDAAPTAAPDAAPPSVPDAEPEPPVVSASPPGLLRGFLRRWSRLRPRTRFALAAAAGAASLLAGLGLTVAASWMIVRASAQPPILTLSLSVVAVRGFAIARPLLRYLERMASHEAGLEVLAFWRGQVVQALIPLVPGRLTARRGALLTRTVDDVDRRLDGAVRGAVPLVASLIALGVVALGLSWLHPQALLPFIAAVLICAVLAPAVQRLADRRREPERQAAREDLQDAVVAAAESTDSLDHVLVTAIAERSARSERAEAAVARAEGATRLLTEAGIAVAALGMAVTAGAALSGGELSPEGAGILVLGSLALAEVLVIAPAAQALRQGREARERLAELAQEAARAGQEAPPSAPVSQGAPMSRSAPVSQGSAQPGGLVLSSVSAGWDGQAVIENVSLQVAPGQTVRIRWPSGTGKSTLAGVILGLREPLAGTIEVAGRSASAARRAGLVALAGEGDHLFRTTLRENLRLARPEATDAQLRAALQMVQLGPWWDTLEDGLDTWVSADSLSGGERRRLVLARALLRDPAVLVLDEPSAGLDAATAAAVLDAVQEDARRHARALLILENLPEATATD